MKHVPSRHPYTYSADLIRHLGYAESRSEASSLRGKISDTLGIDDAWLAGVLSEAYQDRTFQVVHAHAGPVPEGMEIPDPEKVRIAVIAALCRDADTEDLSHCINEALKGHIKTDQSFTVDQLRHLPDLVALAMTGFALLKSDAAMPEHAHPAIAAFHPMVADTLKERMDLAREEAQMRYRFEADPGLDPDA